MRKIMLWGGILLTLAVAFGGPISLFRLGNLWNSLKSKTFGSANAASLGDDPADHSAATRLLPTDAPAAARMPIEGAPITQLTDVFRFDVSPTWVLQRWPRVSTNLTTLELRGYRVPLVTGTKLTDLAGALTYYFNSAQQVHKITFTGKTGDPRTLIELLQKNFRCVRRPVNDPGRLIYEAVRSSGQSAGQVVINSTPVIRANRPLERYDVELLLERPE
jgi:hypothetical protein